MKRWALAGLAAVLLAVVAFGLWWIASPRLAEGDRLLFALQVAFTVLLSGGVAFGLGKLAGRDAEREAAREAVEALQIRRQRMEAQIAARRAEREQIAARMAEPKQIAARPAEKPRLTGGPSP